MQEDLSRGEPLNKCDLGIDKDDIRYIFKLLYDNGKLSENEYKKALVIISTYTLYGNSTFL